MSIRKVQSPVVPASSKSAATAPTATPAAAKSTGAVSDFSSATTRATTSHCWPSAPPTRSDRSTRRIDRRPTDSRGPRPHGHGPLRRTSDHFCGILTFWPGKIRSGLSMLLTLARTCQSTP